jgi:hypothetical protein
MPVSKYDKYYGSKKGSASKALNALRERYGTAKGTSIFYAKANKERASRPKSRYEGEDTK